MVVPVLEDTQNSAITAEPGFRNSVMMPPKPPNIPDLSRQLVEQLDDETRGQLRLLVFLLASNVQKADVVESYLAALYDGLEPKKTG
jgi:hypothetical protein